MPTWRELLSFAARELEATVYICPLGCVQAPECSNSQLERDPGGLRWWGEEASGAGAECVGASVISSSPGRAELGARPQNSIMRRTALGVAAADGADCG